MAATKPSAARTNPSRPPLTRDTIVAAGIALADAEGVAKLTMRKLAKHLGYEVMSLYNHVANKGELLTLMVDSVTSDVEHAPAQPVEPLAAARSIALSLRANLVRHPWASGLWLERMPGPERTRVMEDLLRLLNESDLSPDLAHHGFHAISNHVQGYTLIELAMATVDDSSDDMAKHFRDGLPADEFPHTIAHVDQHIHGDPGSSFELVLDMILDGLVRQSRGT